jgi:hypothetical protein
MTLTVMEPDPAAFRPRADMRDADAAIRGEEGASLHWLRFDRAVCGDELRYLTMRPVRAAGALTVEQAMIENLRPGKARFDLLSNEELRTKLVDYPTTFGLRIHEVPRMRPGRSREC